MANSCCLFLPVAVLDSLYDIQVGTVPLLGLLFTIHREGSFTSETGHFWLFYASVVFGVLLTKKLVFLSMLISQQFRINDSFLSFLC